MLIGLGWGWESLLHPLSPSKPMHTHMQEYTCFLFTAQRSSSSWFLARPPFPNVPVCMSRIGKGTTNTCGALVPSSWKVRGRSASSLCPPESPVQLELCQPGLQPQPAAGSPRIWHYVKWGWTHLANEHSLALFLWALFSIGSFFWIRSFCPTVQSGKPQVSLQRHDRVLYPIKPLLSFHSFQLFQDK